MRNIYNFSFETISVALVLIGAGCAHRQVAVTDTQPAIEAIYRTDEPEIKELGDGWFEVIGQVTIQNITPEEAKRRAIVEACQKAIEYYSGVKIDGRTLDVQAGSQDTVLWREIPMSERLVRALESIPKRSPYIFCNKEGKPFRDVRRSFHTALKLAGIEDFHFHDLRHTFASNLVMAGVDITTVKEPLGHKP